MSKGTRSLVEASNLFLDTGVNLGQVQTFAMWQPFQVGEFTITPYLMDHSAPDAAAFLIEADGKRVFYTGDFRGHGRKGILLKRLLADPIQDVDCLIMEGSMIGRDKGLHPDEKAVEKAISDILAHQRSYTFVFCSSQNLDRLVSIYRAVKGNRKTLVIDLYTALVLDKLGSISASIPQFDWKEVRVLWGPYHYKKIREYDSSLLRDYGKSKIKWEEIKDRPHDMVILAKDNRYFRSVMLRKLEPAAGAKAIYSMWHGYLERTDLLEVLESHHIEFVEIHTSGHAYVENLKGLALAIKPRSLVPIHTFNPEQYSQLFSNVVQLNDDEERTV
jgi:ribonuclease J